MSDLDRGFELDNLRHAGAGSPHRPDGKGRDRLAAGMLECLFAPQEGGRQCWTNLNSDHNTILSISPSVIVSLVRSYSFVVRGDSWAAMR